MIYHRQVNVRLIVKRKKTHLCFTCCHEPMGKGRIESEDSWERSDYRKPNSEEYDLMKFACNYKKNKFW